MRALLVVNRQSRRGPSIGNTVAAALRGCSIEVVEDGEAHGPIDCIVAAGGDGTFVRLIERAIALDVPMGLIPLGTFNELARTLELPFDLQAACEAIAAGNVRAIDVARVNGVYYVNEASIGISSRIARLQQSAQKQRFGFVTVVATALAAFRHSRPMRVAVSFDDRTETFKTVQLTVANSHRFGGVFSVADASLDDGWLDLYSIAIDNAYEAYRVARAIAEGKRQSVPGLRTYRSTAFTIRTRRAHRITADGEPAGRTPATFRVFPGALRVFVPPPGADELSGT